MKKLIALFAASIMIAISANVMAQTETANTTATATIITPITITKLGDLAFGKIVANTGGTLKIEASESGTKTPVGITSLTGATHAASFTVSGDAGSAYTLILPTSAKDLTILGGGTEKMTINDFKSNLTDNKGTVSASTIYVGATLSVASGQRTGTYSGTFDVTVAYN